VDAYVSNELAAEMRQAVLRHVEGCAECSDELNARTRLRSRLKDAVNAQGVPPELRVRIREQIKSGRSNQGAWISAAGWQWAGALAACLMIAAALWLNRSIARVPGLDDRPAQDAYIARVSAILPPF
jgi:anti-sigma factor RsiW